MKNEECPAAASTYSYQNGPVLYCLGSCTVSDTLASDHGNEHWFYIGIGSYSLSSSLWTLPPYIYQSLVKSLANVLAKLADV